MKFLTSLLERVLVKPSEEPSFPTQESRHEEGWPLDKVVLNWQLFCAGQKHWLPYTLRDCCTGIAVTGATGSGKTSGTADFIAHGFLTSGFGGLVLCAKPEEAHDWKKRARRAGREEDLIFFDKTATHRLNLLDYEAKQTAGVEHGQTEGLLQLVIELCEVLSNSKNEMRDSFFDNYRDKLLRNTLELLQFAREPLSFTIISHVVTDDAYAEELLRKAEQEAGSFSLSRQKDLLNVRKFFSSEWRNAPDKTKQSVIMTLTGVIDPYQWGLMRELFSTHSTVSFNACEEGKIFVVDVDAVTHKASGQLANAALKYLFQKHCERREKKDNKIRPLFLFADEAQYFATRRDAIFQSTARSSKVVTVYLTQNLSAYRFGGGEDGLAARKSLLANLVTKMFHQNADDETNQWAADTISKSFQERQTFTQGANQGHGNREMGVSSGTSKHKVYDYEVQPSEFQDLLTGGPQNNLVTTAILFPSGRVKFPNGKSWSFVGFKQKD